MKWFLILLWFPFAAEAQTIHVADNHIVYEGKGHFSNASGEDFLQRAQTVLSTLVKNGSLQTTVFPGNKKVEAKGCIHLPAPFQLTRELHFYFRIRVNADGYDYSIDSVFYREGSRGGKLKITREKELLDGREQSGTAAAANEKLLNEIDMHFQKMIALFAREMQKPVE